MTNPETVYHYTTGKALTKILRAGAIAPSPSFSKATEKAAVWCSVREDWEPSAASIYTLPNGQVIRRTKEEIRSWEGGLVRIRPLPEVRTFSWEQFRRISRISPKHLRFLSNFSEKCGADIRQWRVIFGSLPVNLWACVEIQDSESQTWMPQPIQTRSDLISLLHEIQDCLPRIGKPQRIRLLQHLERLHDRVA